MKVILRETHENLGRPGDEVEVKPGYARNFLVPQGIAYPLNRFYKRLFEVERDELLKKDAEARANAEKVAEQGQGIEIEFNVKIGDRGKMFGAITNNDIAKALAEKGVEVDRRKIALPAPINTTGEHMVTVKPHGDVAFEVKVTLIGEEMKGQLRQLSIKELVEGETGEEVITPADVEAAADNVGVELVELEPATGEEVVIDEGETAEGEEAPEAEAEEEKSDDDEEKAE